MIDSYVNDCKGDDLAVHVTMEMATWIAIQKNEHYLGSISANSLIQNEPHKQIQPHVIFFQNLTHTLGCFTQMGMCCGGILKIGWASNWYYATEATVIGDKQNMFRTFIITPEHLKPMVALE